MALVEGLMTKAARSSFATRETCSLTIRKGVRERYSMRDRVTLPFLNLYDMVFTYSSNVRIPRVLPLLTLLALYRYHTPIALRIASCFWRMGFLSDAVMHKWVVFYRTAPGTSMGAHHFSADIKARRLFFGLGPTKQNIFHLPGGTVIGLPYITD